MSKPLNKGEAILTGIIALAIIFVIMSFSPKEDRGIGVFLGGEGIYDGGNSNDSSEVEGTTIRSAGESSSISIGSGNAAYAYQPYEEYITIENKSKESINITGWQLKNGKDRRPYYQGGQLQRFSADIALIPEGVRVLSPTGVNILQNIVLEPGERAVVTTAVPAIQSPFRLTSFKENMCTGYIENLPEYAFTPALKRNCPRPSSEPGQENLDIQCREFLKTLPACQTPKIGGKDSQGEKCPNCVNGKRVSSICQEFVEERFSYQGCLANHQGEANFDGSTWRIFLGRGWEMWAEDYESIELFNSFGQLVDFENY